MAFEKKRRLQLPIVIDCVASSLLPQRRRSSPAIHPLIPRRLEIPAQLGSIAVRRDPTEGPSDSREKTANVLEGRSSLSGVEGPLKLPPYYCRDVGRGRRNRALFFGRLVRHGVRTIGKEVHLSTIVVHARRRPMRLAAQRRRRRFFLVVRAHLDTTCVCRPRQIER
jgi:hypothetical protein